jgi:hypothetical protein
MSANLDLVRSIFADWERGDFSRDEWADPDIEFAWIGGLAPGRWIGLRGMSEAMREMLSAWKSYRVIAEEFREVDAERVLVVVRAEGQGRISGIRHRDVGDAVTRTNQGDRVPVPRGDAQLRRPAAYPLSSLYPSAHAGLPGPVSDSTDARTLL